MDKLSTIADKWCDSTNQPASVCVALYQFTKWARQQDDDDYAAAQRVWDEWRVSKEADSGVSFVAYFQSRVA